MKRLLQEASNLSVEIPRHKDGFQSSSGLVREDVEYCDGCKGE
jgi:hypothetical protein